MTRTFNEDAPLVVPLRTWSSKRLTMQRNGRLKLVDHVVMATNGPNAARMVREIVAERWALYGPKDQRDGSERAKSKTARKTRRSEAEAS